MNEAEKKNRLFTDRMFRRLFFPSIFSAIGLALGDVADALFVGIRIGQVGLATMSLVVPIYMIFNVLDVGFAIGASVEYTHCLGKGKAREGISIFSQMAVVTLIVSIVIMGLGLFFMPQILTLLGAGDRSSLLWGYTKEYLQIMFLGTPLTFLYFLLYYCVRCDDGEKLASVGYLTGYSVDVIASALFVLGFGWEVKGAILATVLGKLVGVVILLSWIIRKDSILRFKLTKIDIRKIINISKTGFSSSSGYILQFFAALIVNNILVRLGGEAAMAEYNVVQNVSYLCMAIFAALGDTVQPLAGTFYAEHNQEGIKRIIKLACRIGLAVGLAETIAALVLAPQIGGVFGLTEAYIKGGSLAIRLYCLSVLPAGFNVLFGSYFQSVKREKEVFLINCLRTFAVSIPVALFLTPFGISWFWLWFDVSEVVSILIWTPISVRKSKSISKVRDGEVLAILLDSTNRDLAEVIERSEAFCEEHGANMKQTYYVTMCLEEVCQAIIDNAFMGKGDEYIQMTLVCETPGSFSLHITDNAYSFNPFAMKTGRNYMEEEDDLASLGIQMVKTKAKSFFYRRYNGFNSMVVEV